MLSYYKSALILSVFLLLDIAVHAQKVFSVPYESQAQVKVFVVKYESQAD
ncbi:MAG: hypothetical protein ACK5B6_01950 [Bacteroidia bacterium]